MSLNTDLNVSPYYDDFDTDKNFHRILFKPGFAIQAREMTQLQSILQNQVERFGNNILQEGTIIEGCNFTEISNLKYVKILDLNTNGQPVPMSNYAGALIVGSTTGVTGVVQDYDIGLESQDPDLNTLYLKYTGTGTSNSEIKTFAATENLEIRYLSNNALIDTVTAAGSVLAIPATAVGDSYGVRVGEGIIYQKGFFTRVDPQLAIVSKYDSAPNNAVVGFQTAESLINSDVDTSLLDNAAGYNNYQAPGADRLKLTPILTVLSKTAAQDDETFFAIQEYMYGKVVRRNLGTQYNGIMNVIEQRTKEESGNYIVKDFSIKTSNNTVTTEVGDITVGKSYIITTLGTTDFTTVGAPAGATVGTIFTATAIGSGTGEVRENSLNLDIGAGVAYVEGKRVELLNKIVVDLPKSDTFATEVSQSVTSNYGNYVLVKEYMGVFDYNKAATVNLFDTYQTSVTDGSIGANSGVSIGTAKVVSMEYDSGTMGANTSYYRVYLSDIKMSSTYNWNNVKSIVYGTSGTADLVDTTIYDQSFKRRMFKVGRDSLKAFPAATTSATYTYRSVNNSITVPNNGIAFTFTPPIGTFPYSGTLTSTQRNDFLLIASANSSPYIKNKPIDLSAATMSVSGSVLSITVPSCATAMANCTLYYNGQRTGLTAPTKKVLETVYVKIACTNNVSTSVGPWSLGFPDAYRIDKVYVGSANTYAAETTTNDKTSYFSLNTNQKDDYYGLSTISKKSGIALDQYSTLLVKMTRFKKSSVDPDNGFFTVSSYPIDDVNTANTSAIQTYNIPSYKSTDNMVYDLRDVVDFRLYAVNTAANSATSASASVNPSSTITLNSGSELYIPAPNEALVSNYSYYLARKDYLMIDGSGNIVLKQGTPADDPIPPRDPSNGMVLADINVPEYPSLSSGAAASLNKKRYGVDVTPRRHRRYTMDDVGDIATRVNRLEYYSALSLLETDTKDLMVTDSNGLNRFKNGILVDNFNDLMGAELTDPDFSAGYDVDFQEIVPRFREYPLEVIKDVSINDSNIRYYKDGFTISDTTNLKIIDQPYGTYHKETVTNTYDNTGTIQIYPNYDLGKDTIVTPQPSGLGDPIYEYSADGLSLKTSTLVWKNGGWYNWGYHKGKWEWQNVTISTSTFNSAFARPQDIRIKVTGLKPKTRYWIFLNGKATNVLPGHYTSGTDITSISTGYGTRDTSEAIHGDWQHDITSLWYESGEMSVLSDSKGELLAVLDIPPNNLSVGQHKIQVYDKTTLDSTVVGTAIYSAYNDGDAHGFAKGRVQPMAPITFKTGGTTTSTEVVNVNDSATCDYLSQTFTIKRSMGNDSVIVVDTLDLYFQNKPLEATGHGVTIQICGTINDKPNPNDIIASKYLHNSQISVSTTAATATVVAFDDLVVLKTDATYAIVVIADGHNPNFRTWIARAGDKDVIKQIAVTKDAFTGTLFTSTNGLSWTPNTTDNLKFTLYNNQYNGTGVSYLTNANHEFFTIVPTGITYIDNKGHTYGETFTAGELVVKLTANIAPTITTTTNSYDVTTSADATGTFASGDWLAYWSVGANNQPVVDVAKVVAANTTIITLDRVPLYANTAAKVFKTVVGKVAYYNTRDNILHLKDSSSLGSGSVFKFSGNNTTTTVTAATSNTTAFVYTTTNSYSVGNKISVVGVNPSGFNVINRAITAANATSFTIADANTAPGAYVGGGTSYLNYDTASKTDVVWGTKSNSSAIVSSLDALNVSTMKLNIDEYNFTNTNTKFELDFIAGASPTFTRNNTNQPISVMREIPYHKYLGTIPSTSLESEQGFRISATLNNTYTAGIKDSTPIVNFNSGLISVFEHIINANSSGETLPIGGSALTKYITKSVTLEENLDAEDLKVYLTGYRPSGANIEVYGRFRNKNDQRPFNEIEWTKLILKNSTDLTSSVSDLYDYREFEYNMPSGAILGAGAGAILDSANSNKLTYRDPSGATYTDYKYFALKIVLLAAAHNVVPRVKNLRAIALT